MALWWDEVLSTQLCWKIKRTKRPWHKRQRARVRGPVREGLPLTVALLLPGVALLVGVLLLVARLLLGCALLVARLLLAVLRASCGGKETHGASLETETAPRDGDPLENPWTSSIASGSSLFRNNSNMKIQPK